MARKRTIAQAPPATPPRPEPSLAEWLPVGLAAAAVFFSALGGGSLYDRVFVGGPVGPMALVGTPLAALLTAIALTYTVWRPADRDLTQLSPALRLTALLSVGFLAWCALSLARSSYLHTSLATLGSFLAAFAAGVVAFRTAGRLPRALWLAAAISGAATLVSAVGVNEYMTELRGGNAYWRVFAGFVNPDFLAGYLVMAVPVSISLLLAARAPAARLAAGTALLLQAACLVMTGSRLGLLTLVISVAALVVMVIRGRLLSPQARRIALIAAAVVVVGIAAAGRPVVRRLLQSGTESYSAQFRTRTWRGTERMAASNPILGTGVGTFETAYGPYAVVGYTQHAHDSYLQLAAETGFPGAILFVGVVATVLWYGARGTRAPMTADNQTASDDADTTARLVLAGLVAAVLAGALHNLTDSDLYVPANCLTLGLLCGLTLRLARVGSGTSALPMLAASKAGVSFIAIALAAHALIVLAGRISANGAEIDSQAAFAAGAGAPSPEAAQAIRTSLESAAQGFHDAESRDFLNPEYPLKLATVLESMGDRDGAEKETRKAIDRARIGKTYYRLGKLLAREGRMGEAATAHEQTRRIEPNNLDNLLALADDYVATNRQADAEAVWRHMADLAQSDFGRIRAVPEMVEWQYGRAYQLLGQAELQRGENEAAAGRLRQAVDVLGLFWKQRDQYLAQIRVRPEDRRRTAEYYRDALASYEKALRNLGRSQEADKVNAAAAAFESERSAFESKSATSSQQ